MYQLSADQNRLAERTREIWARCDELVDEEPYPFPFLGQGKMKHRYPLHDEIRALRHDIRALKNLETRVLAHKAL